MSDLSQALTQKKLLVWATIREALKLTWLNRVQLLPWVIPWVVVLGLGGYLIEYSFLDIELVRQGSASSWDLLVFWFWAILLSILRITVFVLFAVWWHRKILLGESEKIPIKYISFSQRENKFLRYVFGVGCIATLAMLPGIIILGLLSTVSDDLQQLFAKQRWLNAFLKLLVMYVPSMYFVGKYCLIFPATAVDFHPIKEWSWPKNLVWSSEQVKGNEWQLAFLVGALPFLFEWFSKVFLFLLGLNEQGAIVYSLVFSLLWVPLIPIEIAVLSIAFRELTNWTPTSQFPESTQH